MSALQQGTSAFQQGFDFVRGVPQIAQQFRAIAGGPGAGGGPADQPGPAFGPSDGGQPAYPPPNPPYAPQYPSPMPGIDAGAGAPPPPGVMPAASSDGQMDLLLQALRQRQIPPLPNPYSAPAMPPAPMAAPADPLALLRLIFSNPQLLQALNTGGPVGGQRTVDLPVVSTAPPQQTRRVPIPLGAVMNAIITLAGASLTEINADTSEDEPEVPGYLVDDDGQFIVDPANGDDRAALVTHLFRLSAETQDAGEYDETFDEGDGAESWAGDAGY